MLEESIKNALDKTSKIVIVSDLNVNLLSTRKSRLTDILKSQNLHNVVNKPTRVTATSMTLIDHIILSDDFNIEDCDVIEFDQTISDHRGVYVTLATTVSTKMSYSREVWCYLKGNCNKLNALMYDVNWVDILSACTDVNNACELFYANLINFIRDCIPSETVKIRPNDKPWFNSEIRRECRKRDR